MSKRTVKKSMCMKEVLMSNCPCGNDLEAKGSVCRTYTPKDEKYPESHCFGHYDSNGDFEPDSSPSYPVVHHDLVDGSDTCDKCGAVVG